MHTVLGVSLLSAEVQYIAFHQQQIITPVITASSLLKLTLRNRERKKKGVSFQMHCSTALHCNSRQEFGSLCSKLLTHLVIHCSWIDVLEGAEATRWQFLGSSFEQYCRRQLRGRRESELGAQKRCDLWISLLLTWVHTMCMARFAQRKVFCL
jgi:hypothetical protein